MYKKVLLIVVLLMLLAGNASAALVGRWTFDDGTANDSVVTNHGTVSAGGATIVTDAVRGKVLDLDGTTGYVTIPVAAFDTICKTGGNKVTISLWQYGDNIASSDGVHHFMFHGRAGTVVTLGCYMLTNTGKIQFTTFTSDNAGKIPASASEYNGQWNHYAYTFDSAINTIKIYQNGVLYASSTGKNQSLIRTMTAFRLGASTITNPLNGAVQNFYSGMIDDFRVYNRVLTDGEILTLAGGAAYIVPMNSPANLVVKGVAGQEIINYKDFNVIAGNWLKEILWP